jgi:hypothetical protein
MEFHLSRMLNPQHEIGGRIRELASDVIALANTVQTRADQTSSSGNTGNLVACIAAILTNLGSP